MSSVALTGLSNISSDALQIRYQKALKQINKLIEINRQLKESTTQKDGQILELSAQISELQRNVRQLDEQNNLLESKYMELERHYHQLENYCKQLERKMQDNHLDDKDIEAKLREHQMKFQEELQNQIIKYNQLAREAEMIHQVYQENLIALQEHQVRQKTLEQETIQLHEKVNRLEHENQKLAQNLKQNSNQELRKRLQQANVTIQKLMKECTELKNKQIDLEVLQQRQKVEKYLGFSLFNDPRQNDAVKLLINEYRKKIQTLQSSKKQIQAKYKHLKQKYMNISLQNYQSKIEKLEKLTQKQQLEIAKLIQTYDRQLNSIFKENKQLKQGLQSLSYRFKQKSLDLEQKEKQISQLKLSTQKVSFENQSLKKLNQSLISAKTNTFSRDFGYVKKDFSHSQSLTYLEKIQSMQKAAEINNQTQNTDFLTAQQKARQKSKTGENLVGQKVGISMTYPHSNQSDFRFIQSVNIINGYNVNLGQATHLNK